mmetsp:Transcript_98874/g.275204  ORF Transcript_98874/g.275204 Transcript_98874/m.275204 type:complete len:322 (+) Transcript_98874:662-1627(+)
MQAAGKPCVDGRRRVTRAGHEDLGKVHRAPTVEVRPGAVATHARHAQTEAAALVHSDEGLLGDHRRGRDADKGHASAFVAAMARRRTQHAHEDRIPVGIPPATNVSVPCAPLLLAGGADLAHDVCVGHEATARVAHADARHVLRQVQRSRDDEPPQRCCLRHGPEHVALSPEVLGAAPEGAERAAEVTLVASLTEDPSGGVKNHVVGAVAQTQDLRVEPNRNIDMVDTWLEEEGEAGIRELAVVYRDVPTICCEGLANRGLDLTLLPWLEDSHTLRPHGWVGLVVAFRFGSLVKDEHKQLNCEANSPADPAHAQHQSSMAT